MNDTVAPGGGEAHVSAVDVLTSPRFWPLFWAQFMGAFNDNLIKMAAILMIAYQGRQVWGVPADQVSTLAPGLLILPALLFAAMAGQWADRASKSSMIIPIKLIEVGLMTVAAMGFIYRLPGLLMWVILGLGVQSTFFGPLKYSILPQLLTDRELVAGNALIETGTNLAILTGSILGGWLIADKANGLTYVSGALIGVSLIGYWSARHLVHTPPEAPDLEVNRNFVASTIDICRSVHQTPTIFRAILAISWFWVYGFGLVALFVPYAKNVVHASEGVQTFFLALFSIGVGVGSMLCEKLSFDRLELGLVPIGSIGMSIFAADLYFAWVPDRVVPSHLLDVVQFLAHPGGARVTFDMVMISLFTGFYIVPLYTFIQARAKAEVRSRVVAANNIVNSLFMVVWAVVQMLMLHYLAPIKVLLVLAILNAVVAIYIYTVIPEFALRFLIYLLVHVMYRVRARHLSFIPSEGAAVLVCNHVSFVDWLIIYGLVARPVRFVMHYSFYNMPVARILFRQAHTIPIATAHEDETIMHQAMDRVAEELEQGELVCIFPEGRLTPDGEIGQFKKGIEKMIERTPVPVIPMALQGLWGSYFSRQGGRAFKHPFHRVWSHIGLVAGPAIPAAEVDADALRSVVAGLRGTEA